MFWSLLFHLRSFFLITFFTFILSSDTLEKSLKYVKDQQALQRTSTGFLRRQFIIGQHVYSVSFCTIFVHVMCPNTPIHALFSSSSFLWLGSAGFKNVSICFIQAHSRPSLVQPNLALLGKQASHERLFLQRCFLVQSSSATLFLESHHRLGVAG